MGGGGHLFLPSSEDRREGQGQGEAKGEGMGTGCGGGMNLWHYLPTTTVTRTWGTAAFSRMRTAKNPLNQETSRILTRALRLVGCIHPVDDKSPLATGC